MKRIRTIATAMMLGASLLGSTTYALMPSEEADKVEANEPEAPGFPSDYSGQNEDEMSAEEKSANEGIKAANSSEVQDKKSKRGKETSDSSSTDWWGIIALVIGAGGVALGWTNHKSIENLNKNNKELKANTNKTVSELTGRIVNLEQNISIARQTIDKQNNMISSLRKTQESLNANNQPSYDSQVGAAIDTPTQHYQGSVSPAPQATPQPPQQPIRLYCGAPNSGVFTNPSRTPSNKALYIITYIGGGTSSYSYVDTRDGAMLAARSISDFLEPGCIISGTKNPNFTKVKTITPGIVRRMPNGTWTIESKAVVELV